LQWHQIKLQRVHNTAILSEKQSEIDIVKQMIKSTNVTLKAREKDQIQLRKKVVHLEGMSLAAR